MKSRSLKIRSILSGSVIVAISVFVAIAFMAKTGVRTAAADEVPTGTLLVVTQVINDDSGTLSAADFAVTITGAGATPASFAGTAVATPVTVNADEIFTVEQTEDPGYTTTYDPSCFGKVVADETVTCTVTNDDIAAYTATTGTLILITQVINNDAGVLNADDFSSTVTDGSGSHDVMGSALGAVVELQAGDYTVTQSDVDGYGTVLDSGCEGSVSVGETVTCTITNDDTSLYVATTGTLIVVTLVQSAYGGTETASDFTVTVSGNSPAPASAPGSAAGAIFALEEGAYSVGVSDVSDYIKTIGSGCSGSISVGQTINCSVTAIDYQAVPQGGTGVSVGSGGGGGSSGLVINQSASTPIPQVLGVFTEEEDEEDLEPLSPPDADPVVPIQPSVESPKEVENVVVQEGQGDDSRLEEVSLARVMRKKRMLADAVGLNDWSPAFTTPVAPEKKIEISRISDADTAERQVFDRSPVSAPKAKAAKKPVSPLAHIPNILFSMAAVISFTGLCFAAVNYLQHLPDVSMPRGRR